MSKSPEELLFSVAYTTEDAHTLLELLKEFFETFFFAEREGTSRSEMLSSFIKDKSVSDNNSKMLMALPDEF